MSSVRDVRLSRFFFFFNDTATTEIYTLSLHDALPISTLGARPERHPPAVLLLDDAAGEGQPDPPATRLVGSAGLEELMLRSEEHTSELQSRLHLVCRLLLEKKKKKKRSLR